MAEYKAFEPGVEVIGQSMMVTIKSFPSYMKDKALEILAENGLKDIKPEKWYSQQSVLDSQKIIAEKFGSNTLFMIGKNVPENAIFPPGIDSIEKALNMLDMAYKMNHRGGDFGFYKLSEHDKTNKKLILHCRNPYPEELDKGLITALARKFEAAVVVELAPGKPSRKDGADDSWYEITYK